MKMKHATIVIFFICTLSCVMCLPLTSGTNYCEPGKEGYLLCEAKKAVCKINDNSYICECPAGMQFGLEGNDECEEMDMCGSDSQGYRYCESDLALCRNAPNNTKGYECYCAEGKVKIGGLCKDVTEETLTDSSAELESTSSPLSSSVLSSTGTENTSFETFHNSSKSSITYTSPDLSSTNSPSTFHPPALTTYNHDRSTNLISDIPDIDECAGHQCDQNATCIKLSHGFTCQCKVGYVPHKKFPSTKSHCRKNCTVQGCEDICKEIKCILKEEKEKSTNASTCLYFENKHSGWPTESIMICSLLSVLVLIFIISTAVLLHRYKKLRRMRQLEDNQIVYRKMDKGSLRTESVRESLPNGVVIVSYVFPNSKASKDNDFLTPSSFEKEVVLQQPKYSDKSIHN